MKYTMQDYSDIFFTGFTYKLPENTNIIIKKLTGEIIITSTDTNNENNNMNESKFKKSGYFNNSTSSRKQKNFSKHTGIDDVWEATKVFKPTKIEKKEGVDKLINDIRISLNKISTKNYEMHRNVIIEYIENIIKSGEDSSDEEDITVLRMENGKSCKNSTKDINSIAIAIFDIASTNKFYSELYATLYKELIEKFPVFIENVSPVVELYKESIHKIKFVDSNIDYDKFCDNNKLNDKRKALSAFIVNLMKIGVIEKSIVTDTILYLLDIVVTNIDIKDMVYEIEEITENIFLFITMSISEVKSDNKHEKIINSIKMLSQCKVKEHLSISSRAIFKYMDILDKINK